MLTTAAILDSFRNLPEKVTLDEAVERLIILDRYERAMDPAEQGKGHKNEDVMQEMKEWIQASR